MPARDAAVPAPDARPGDGPAATPAPTPIAPAGRPGCGLDKAAFCDGFDQPSPGGRAGDLDERRWSIGRVSQGVNPSQGYMNGWPPAVSTACGQRIEGVIPDQDHAICSMGDGNKVLAQTFHDGGNFAYYSMRVRQPMDFAGRTGNIAFDVDLRATGHGWWVEMWLTDQPVPAPYQGAPAVLAPPRNGFAIQFDFGGCYNQDPKTTSSVSGLFLFKDYKVVREFHGGDIKERKCFKVEDGVPNHFEVRVSETHAEVWATDAGNPASFRRVALREGIPMPLSRGFLHLQHVHYNAVKGGVTAYRTYHWDNVAFDGPVLPTPRAYEVADALQRVMRTDDSTTMNVGYAVSARRPRTFMLEGVDPTNAAAASLNLNLNGFLSTTDLQFRFNDGEWQRLPHPFSDSTASWRALSVPVELAKLRAGANALEFKMVTGDTTTLSNIDLTVDPR